MEAFHWMKHIAARGGAAYYLSTTIRDPKSRLDLLITLQLTEESTILFFENLSQRANREGDDWLSEKLMAHAKDERRHSTMMKQCLKRLDPDLETKSAQLLESAKGEGRGSLGQSYFAGYTEAELAPDSIAWKLFMASTYILEEDASQDFRIIANALPDDDDNLVKLKTALTAIAKDEIGHASYLLEAMNRYYKPQEVSQLIRDWRNRKTDALFASALRLPRL